MGLCASASLACIVEAEVQTGSLEAQFPVFLRTCWSDSKCIWIIHTHHVLSHTHVSPPLLLWVLHVKWKSFVCKLFGVWRCEGDKISSFYFSLLWITACKLGRRSPFEWCQMKSQQAAGCKDLLTLLLFCCQVSNVTLSDFRSVAALHCKLDK